MSRDIIKTKLFDNRQIAEEKLEQIKDQLFECKSFGKIFPTAQNLVEHFYQVHAKSKDFLCSICDQTFQTKGNLQAHIKGVHENKRDYECSICGKLS